MRHEFPKSVKQAALRRSGGVCEAEGKVYGLEPGTRCTRLLSEGVDFDHYPLPAHAEGSNTLENCQAVCRPCHKHKSATFDTPFEAKLKRSLRKRGLGSKPPKPKAKIAKPTKSQWPKGQRIQSRGWDKR